MQRKYTYLFLFLITLGAFFIRIYKLTESPGGFYIDETSIAYNAYSIVETGKDEHGIAWPIFFEAFGEWKFPVYIYSVVLLQAVFGPQDFTVRLAAVLFGTATVIFFYGLIKEVMLHTTFAAYVKETAPLVATLLLAIAPWHFQYTHAGFEASSGLFLLVFALWCYFKAMRKQSVLWLVASVLGFSLCLYSYNSARIVVPVIAGMLFFFYRIHFSLKQWFIVAGIGFLVSFPFIRFAFSDAGWVRAKQISIFYDQQYKGRELAAFGERYLRHLSPYSIFYYGDPTIADLSPYRMGWHYPIEAPFFLVGLIVLLKSRNRALLIFPLIILIGFIPPAITTSYIHGLRGIFALIGTTATTAIGMSFLLSYIHHMRIRAGVLSLLVITLVLFAARFLYIYHGRYVPNSFLDWQVDVRMTASAVKGIESAYDEIYFADGISPITMLWELRVLPVTYQQSLDKRQVGKYHFGMQLLPTVESGRQLLLVLRPQQQATGIRVGQIVLPNGKIAYELWQL